MRLAVGADDPLRPAHQRVDPLPAVGRGHQGVAGDARVRRVDAAVLGTGVPLVDGGVELQPGVGAGPGGIGDLLPQLASREPLGDLAVGAPHEQPLAIALEHLEEAVGDADAVVGVLAGDGEIGLAVPVRIVFRERELGDALGRELPRLLDVGLGHHGRPRLAERRAQRRVLLRISVDLLAVRSRHAAGRHHRLEPALAESRAGHEGRDLLLLDDLPADELHRIRVIEVEAHHLGRPPRGPAGLDGPGRAVADLEEGHEPGRLAAARQGLVLAAQRGEIRATATAVLEDARLARPEVHDAAVVDEIVGDGQDEARMNLRALVGGGSARQRAELRIHVVVPLRGTGEPVGVGEPRVEPLRRVGRRDLGSQHVAQLVVESLGVGVAVEVAVALAPLGPAPGQPMEDLPGIPLAAQDGASLLVEEGLPVRIGLRHPGLPEVLLGQDVGGHRRPGGRHRDALLAKDRGAVRVLDLGVAQVEFEPGVGTLAFLGEPAGDLHTNLLKRTPECCRTDRANAAVAERCPRYSGGPEEVNLYLVLERIFPNAGSPSLSSAS